MILLEGKVEPIMKNYFNHKINTPRKMRVRVGLTLLVKLLYIVVNILAFIFTDHVLHGGFMSYGMEWSKWSKLGNEMAHEYMGKTLTFIQKGKQYHLKLRRIINQVA